jgi:hypothetical protein
MNYKALMVSAAMLVVPSMVQAQFERDGNGWLTQHIPLDHNPSSREICNHTPKFVDPKCSENPNKIEIDSTLPSFTITCPNYGKALILSVDIAKRNVHMHVNETGKDFDFPLLVAIASPTVNNYPIEIQFIDQGGKYRHITRTLGGGYRRFAPFIYWGEGAPSPYDEGRYRADWLYNCE